jgi:hypothetical protein
MEPPRSDALLMAIFAAMSEPPLRFPKTQGLLIVLGYLLFVAWAAREVATIAGGLSRNDDLTVVICAFGWLALAFALAAALHYLPDEPRLALALLTFVMLPLWGLALNAELTDQCRSDCPADEYRVLAVPEVYGLFGLHLLTAAGYAISRRRLSDLPVRIEPWVVALLLIGLLQHLALAVQLADLLQWVPVLPVTLPLITPLALIVLFGRELTRRLRASAERAAAPLSLGPALLRSPLIIGAHALLQGLWLGRPSAALDVFARTCSHTFSALPLQVRYEHCGHYLCTVAAHGHPSLVGPERLGVRHGQVIIVNRQLAVANAFEDLLHARFPRFGRAARVCYDRLAIPICGWVKNRWLADLVYLAMKPAEWLFYLTLLVLDPQSPEARIERMYR